MLPRPFLKWAGGKRQILPEIEKSFPKKILKASKFTYIEPFVGSGAVLFRMLHLFGDKLDKILISDINRNLINTYLYVKNNPDELLEHLENLDKNFYKSKSETDRKIFYLKKRELYNAIDEDSMLKSALLIFLNKTCYNGLYRVNSKGGFNVPFGRNKNP